MPGQEPGILKTSLSFGNTISDCRVTIQTKNTLLGTVRCFSLKETLKQVQGDKASLCCHSEFISESPFNLV
jgi:hypothetical protein